MTDKILLVDDDANLLTGLKRHYRKRYDVSTAEGAVEALDRLYDGTAFAVAVVDMRMPGMTGLELLRKLKELSPNTVSIMLTGNADQQTAIDAINKGHIFRFICKPCEPDVLAKAIDDGISQYKLVVAEHELLEKTLAGSVKVLVDVLSITDPTCFGRSDKIRGWAAKISKTLKLEKPWCLDMAAMLVHLGNITVPDTVSAKIKTGEELTSTERDIVEQAPEAARDLISNIPRLGEVADAIYLQNKGFDGSGPPDGGPRGLEIPLESRILKILVDLETATAGPYPTRQAFDRLFGHSGQYDEKLLRDIRKCLRSERPDDDEPVMKRIDLPISMLMPGDLLDTDLVLENAHLIFSAGNQLSKAHVQKIRAMSKIHRFVEPVAILRGEWLD